MYSAIFGLVAPDGEEIGPLVETAILSQYLHEPTKFARIHYARWKQGEVDLVFLNQSLKVQGCAEVKWRDQHFGNLDILKNIFHFCRQTGLSEATITTKSKRGVKKSGDLTLHFVEAAVACFSIGAQILRCRTGSQDVVVGRSLFSVDSRTTHA